MFTYESSTLMEIVRNGQRTTGISLTQKQRAQHQKQSEKNGARPARKEMSSMTAYTQDEYCLAQGGGGYNSKSLGMMYLLAQICIFNPFTCYGKALKNMTNFGF